jgi:hypothetical protein
MTGPMPGGAPRDAMVDVDVDVAVVENELDACGRSFSSMSTRPLRDDGARRV